MACTMDVPGVPVDEGDVFQCGKCLEPFLSLPAFILHKKIHLTENQNEAMCEDDSEKEEEEEDSFRDPNQNVPLITVPAALESDYYTQCSDEGEAAETNESVVQVTNTESLCLFTTSGLLQNPVPINTVPTELDKTNTVIIISNPDEAETCESSCSNSNNSISCIYCDKKFNKEWGLKEHMRSHTGECPFQCPICGRTFSQNSNAKRHIDTHKVWPNLWKSIPQSDENDASLPEGMEDVDSFRCLYCPAVFKSYYSLRLHRARHSNLKVFKCFRGSCRESFKELEHYIKHLGTHTKEYYCHVCKEEFHNLNALGIHQTQHKNKRKTNVIIRCTRCNLGFCRMSSYERHIAEDCYQHKCIRCGKLFSSESKLRRHLKSHISVRSHACDTCGKAFVTAEKLKYHIGQQHNIQPILYKCSMCLSIFKRKDNFFRHRMKHEASKQLNCPFRKAGCYKSFSRTDSLKLHLARHVAGQPICITCCKPLILQYNKDWRSATVICACPENYLEDADEDGKESESEVPTIDVVVMPVKSSGENSLSGDDATFAVMLCPEEPGQPNTTYTIKPFKS